MGVEAKFKKVDAKDAKRLLGEFLEKFNVPAFGAMPKREIELALFELMRDLNLISDDASLYKIMTDLRVTRSKATQLLFDIEVRQKGGDSEKLDEEVRKALIETKLAKKGEEFLLEIENPLVLAHLRDRIRRLGHVSDTSFNAALVRMPVDAAADLITDMVPENQLEAVKKALIKAGATDKSMKGVLKSSIKKLGSKLVGKAADELVDDLTEFLGPIFDGAADTVKEKWPVIFEDKK
jgi:hypothetical protein